MPSGHMSIANGYAMRLARIDAQTKNPNGGEAITHRTPQEILDLPSDFVTRIVGAELVRVRSQTTYYILTRMKGVCRVYLDRQRKLASAAAA